MKQHFETKANIKKFATQAAKGGSIVITIEMPLTDDNALLAGSQSKDCVLTLDFDNDSIERVDGQLMLYETEGGEQKEETGL